MTALTERKLKLLHEFRRGLLDLKKDELTAASLSSYWETRNANVRPMGAGLINPLGNYFSSIQSIDDVDALDAARDDIVKMIDASISSLDGEPVRPILDDLILKIKDVKLATLLHEFNAIKDKRPNIAVIGFRTILCLVIQETAKMLSPLGPLAKTEDLALQPMLDDAIKLKIFSEGLTKLLDAFKRHGLKERSDNVAHKPGSNMLISKSTCRPRSIYSTNSFLRFAKSAAICSATRKSPSPRCAPPAFAVSSSIVRITSAAIQPRSAVTDGAMTFGCPISSRCSPARRAA
jgi:hypothetical protein